MVEVKCSVYSLQRVPRFGSVVEVEVYPINFSWRRGGRGVGEMWWRSDNIEYIFATSTTFWGCGRGSSLSH